MSFTTRYSSSLNLYEKQNHQQPQQNWFTTVSPSMLLGFGFSSTHTTVPCANAFAPPYSTANTDNDTNASTNTTDTSNKTDTNTSTSMTNTNTKTTNPYSPRATNTTNPYAPSTNTNAINSPTSLPNTSFSPLSATNTTSPTFPNPAAAPTHSPLFLSTNRPLQCSENIFACKNGRRIHSFLAGFLDIQGEELDGE